jgi:hypothetical protein
MGVEEQVAMILPHLDLPRHFQGLPKWLFLFAKVSKFNSVGFLAFWFWVSTILASSLTKVEFFFFFFSSSSYVFLS